MREWTLRILSIFLLIVLAVNFVRVLFLPDGSTFELIDIHTVASVLSKFDVPVQELFADLYNSFVALKQGLDSLFDSLARLSRPTVFNAIISLFDLIIAPIRFLVVCGVAIYHFIVFVVSFLVAFYEVLSMLFGSSFI